jgi:hypothetical protein
MTKKFKIFYHCTPEKNITSILNIGLIPTIGKHSSMINELEPQLYLFNSKTALSDGLSTWFGDLFDETEKLIVIKLKLNLNDPYLIYQKESYESLYKKPIVITQKMFYTESTF